MTMYNVIKLLALNPRDGAVADQDALCRWLLGPEV